MVNIKFYLHRVKEAEYTKPIPDPSYKAIYVRYKIGRHVDFKASIGFKIQIENWDASKQRVKNRSVVVNRHIINDRIELIDKKIKEFDSQNVHNAFVPSYSDVTRFYSACIKPKPVTPEIEKIVDEKIGLFQYIEQFIENAKVKKNPNTGKLVAEGTIKTYRLTQKWLIRFDKEVYRLNFDNINKTFHDDFESWCESLDLSLNYIGKLIKGIKVFMNAAIAEEVAEGLTFKPKDFKVKGEVADSIALSNIELEAIWKLDLKEYPRLEQARNLFLIGAYTGLRVSDFSRLKETNIKIQEGIRMIKVTTTKTGKQVAIPLNNVIEEILAINNGMPPKNMPDQKINQSMKVVAKMAEINDFEEVVQTRGGKKVKSLHRRYKLCHTHTARRSFCTNAYLTGMPVQFIMAISGHSSEDNFKKYVKADPEQIAIKMSSHPFFKIKQPEVV